MGIIAEIGAMLVLIFSATFIPTAVGGPALAVLFSKFHSLRFEADFVNNHLQSATFVALPLYLFLGNILMVGGKEKNMGTRFFRGAQRLLGGIPGGMLITVVVVGAILSAICGSGLAVMVTLFALAYPQLNQQGYNKQLSIGTIAGAGLLGPIIPPSTVLVICAYILQIPVGPLFMGGVIPGLLTALIYIIYIFIVVKTKPELGPKTRTGERLTWKGVWLSIKDLWQAVFLIAMVLGGIYGGVTTVTEAAALGVVIGIAFTVFNGALTKEFIKECFANTVKVSAMIYFIMIGANLMTHVEAALGLGQAAQNLIQSMGGVNPWVFFLAMVAMFLVLGCFLEMIILTMVVLPIVYPVIVSLGFDPTWFIIIFLFLNQIGVITPPYGLFLFAAQGATKEKFSTVVKGVVPYLFLFMGATALLIIFPQIVLWLPNMMK